MWDLTNNQIYRTSLQTIQILLSCLISKNQPSIKKLRTTLSALTHKRIDECNEFANLRPFVNARRNWTIVATYEVVNFLFILRPIVQAEMKSQNQMFVVSDRSLQESAAKNRFFGRIRSAQVQTRFLSCIAIQISIKNLSSPFIRKLGDQQAETLKYGI